MKHTPLPAHGQGQPDNKQLTVIRRMIRSANSPPMSPEEALVNRIWFLMTTPRPESLGELAPRLPSAPKQLEPIKNTKERPRTNGASQVRLDAAGYRTDLDAYAVIDLTRKLRSLPDWVWQHGPMEIIVLGFALVSHGLYHPCPFPLPTGLVLLGLDRVDDPVTKEQVRSAFRRLQRLGVLEIVRQGGPTDHGLIPHLYRLHEPA